MKNIQIGTKEKKALLYVMGILIALGVYQFFFTGQLDRNADLSAKNTELQQEVTKLQKLDEKKEKYEADTADMEKESNDIYNQFPADVKEEDLIMYAKKLKDDEDMDVNAVSVSEPILLYTIGEGPENAEDGTADGTQTAEGMAKMLYNAPSTMNFTVSYGNLKTSLVYIKGTTQRKVLDNVSLTYDTETGKIVGTMALNAYFITGTDKLYEEPEIPDVETGTSNIFGSK